MATNNEAPDPRRVSIARANRKKWKGFTPEGLKRLRQAALKNQPWRFSTGPRTAEGKAKMVENGKKRQLGPRSVREIRAELAGIRELLTEMRTASKIAAEAGGKR